jgi:hypothetical protein
VIAIGVEQRLIGVRQITGARLHGNEHQESARAVEELPDTARRHSCDAREYQSSIARRGLPQRACDAWIIDVIEVRGDVADTSVLAAEGAARLWPDQHAQSRKVDGWQTLSTKLIEQQIDIPA